MDIRQCILDTLSGVETELRALEQPEAVFVSLTDYAHWTKTAPDGAIIWTEAIQQALLENRCVHIPAADTPYWIDGTVIIPSHRTIRADGDAVIRQRPGVKVLMFRNEHTVDGTHYPPDTSLADCDICITGGRWEESYTGRAGYGKSGMYDENRSYFGVSTAFLFNNLQNLCLRNMTFAHTAGFAIQLGQLKNALIENMAFEDCYADGVHVGGNLSNLVIRNIHGQVGDDLVALNSYDWLNSSVTFGPMDTVLCENLRPAVEGACKTMRIETGVYTFDDGSQVDCSNSNLIVRDVRDIDAFKLYFQTPGYTIGTEPERGDVGSGSNLFFEDMEIDLRQPGDMMDTYLNSDPIRGNFGAFEMNANLTNVHFRNIRLTLHKDRFPLSWFVTVGPKSYVRGDYEVFDPEFSSTVDGVYFRDITVNGENVQDLTPYIKEVRFRDINQDGRSSGAGTIKNIFQE